MRPERLLGLLARWSGIEAQEITLDEFAERFDIDKLPRQRIVYTDQDDRWLRNQ